MSEASTPPAVSRGAARRQARHQAKERQQAVRQWTQPGVLLFLAVLGLAAVGWWLVFRAGQRIPVEQATVGGLRMHLEEARWTLDQMDHGENFSKPSTMMPGMPEWGKQRVTLDLSFHNLADGPREFRGEEFVLVPEIGDEVPPYGAVVGHARLEPGQSFNTAIHFDFDTTQPHGRLKAVWRREGQSVYLAIPTPPEHYHLRPKGGEIALPTNATLLLPLGKEERGKELYAGVYGCVACHGDPQQPGSNNVGPHLGGVGVAAASRVAGKPPEQYLYESMLEPNAFIAPECKAGQPCREPSAMPEYAALLSLEDAAHLLAYLLSLQS